MKSIKVSQVVYEMLKEIANKKMTSVDRLVQTIVKNKYKDSIA